MKYLFLLFMFILLNLFCMLSVFAEGPVNSGDFVVADDNEKIRQKIEESEKAEMERLKQISPEVYQERIELHKTMDEVSGVLDLYYSKEISEAEAKKRLLPAVEKEVQNELKSINEEINSLRHKIEYLETKKGDPEKLKEDKINQYLNLQPLSKRGFKEN